MTTYTTDRADSGEIPHTPGEDTRVIRRLDDTWIVTLPASARIVPSADDFTAQMPTLPSVGIYPQHAPGSDAWITSGEIPPFLSYALSQGLQDPPTGEPPPLPPAPPTPDKAERRVRFRHRRRLDRLVAGILIGASAVTAALLGVDLAAWAVLGWLR